jgi:hypothetical protein
MHVNRHNHGHHPHHHHTGAKAHAQAAQAPAPKGGLSARDAEALTRAVAAEARGEKPEVWKAVAQAILNYAKQTHTPVHRLVRSSFLSSNFDGNRRFYTMATKHIARFGAMRQAVADAIAGKSPIGKRSHFIDDSIGIPSWGDKHSAVKIGRMIFLNEKK